MRHWFAGWILTVIGLIMLTGPVSAAPARNASNLAAQEDCNSPYVVKYGDSLRKIAKRCGYKVGELIRANPQLANPDYILVGWEINLPVIDPATGEPEAVEPAAEVNSPEESDDASLAVPGSGDEIFVEQAAQEADSTDPGEQVAPVETDTAAVEENLTTDPADASEVDTRHIVERGESLSKIAKRYGLTVAQMMAANPGLPNPNRIYPGQELVIPPASLVADEEAWEQYRYDQAMEAFQNNPTGYTASSGERWILVDLATQTTHAYEGDQLVRSFLVSTGRAATPTVTGQYRIWLKLRYDDMRGPGYYLRDVPYTMYFYKGYGLHGTYWHSNFGTPMSHGCVNLTIDDSAWLYDFAEEGTVVYVQ